MYRNSTSCRRASKLRSSEYCPAADAETTQAMRPSECRPLLARGLVRLARGAGKTLHELVSEYGGSQCDFAILIGGGTQGCRLSDAFIKACASSLKLPPIAVRCLAAEIRLHDFVVPSTETTDLRDSLARLGHGSLLDCLMPPQVHALDDEVKGFVLRCLAAASSGSSGSPLLNLPELRLTMQAALAVDEELGR